MVQLKYILEEESGSPMGNANFVFPYDRQKLVDRVQNNRDKHVATFDEAWKGYLIEVQEQLDDCVKNYRVAVRDFKQGNGDNVEEIIQRVRKVYVNADKPENHADEYDRVIDMLAFTDEEKITLTPQEFNQYVRDEWAWSAKFASSTQTLISKTSAR